MPVPAPSQSPFSVHGQRTLPELNGQSLFLCPLRGIRLNKESGGRQDRRVNHSGADAPLGYHQSHLTAGHHADAHHQGLVAVLSAFSSGDSDPVRVLIRIALFFAYVLAAQNHARQQRPNYLGQMDMLCNQAKDLGRQQNHRPRTGTTLLSAALIDDIIGIVVLSVLSKR